MLPGCRIAEIIGGRLALSIGGGWDSKYTVFRRGRIVKAVALAEACWLPCCYPGGGVSYSGLKKFHGQTELHGLIKA